MRLLLVGVLSCLAASLRVVRMNNTMLSTWYDKYSMCLLKTSTKTRNFSSYDELTLACKKHATNTSFPSGFQPLPSLAVSRNRRQPICCIDELPLADRGFDLVVNGFENGNLSSMREVLRALSQRNMSFVTVGDSMSNQFLEAMRLEIVRLCYGNIVKQKNWTAAVGLGLDDHILTYLDRFEWTPPGKNGNKVYFYRVWVQAHMYGKESRFIQEVFIPHLSSSTHPDGLVILGNIGAHLQEIRTNRIELMNHMEYYLTWLQRMARLNERNVVAFRETTPSHFNSPDGTYERFQAKNYDFESPNPWDKTLYYCKAYQGVNAFTDILRGMERYVTPEDRVVQALLRCFPQKFASVRIFRLAAFLAPFYRLKFGDCGDWRRIDFLDCVHYCSNSPPMWAPVWQELLDLITQPIVTKTNLNLREVWNTDAFEFVTDQNRSQYYVSVGGCIRYPVANLSVAHKISHAKKKIAPRVASREELNGLWVGEELFAVPDGTVIRGNSAALYVVENGTLRHIPNMDIYIGKGLDKLPIVSVSQSVFNSIDFGPPLDGVR